MIREYEAVIFTAFTRGTFWCSLFIEKLSGTSLASLLLFSLSLIFFQFFVTRIPASNLVLPAWASARDGGSYPRRARETPSPSHIVGITHRQATDMPATVLLLYASRLQHYQIGTFVFVSPSMWEHLKGKGPFLRTKEFVLSLILILKREVMNK